MVSYDNTWCCNLYQPFHTFAIDLLTISYHILNITIFLSRRLSCTDFVLLYDSALEKVGMASLNVDKWPIFSLLNPSFLSNIKLACVFGGQGNEALIVTKDDLVYALGSNSSGCLGSGASSSGKVNTVLTLSFPARLHLYQHGHVSYASIAAAKDDW